LSQGSVPCTATAHAYGSAEDSLLRPICLPTIPLFSRLGITISEYAQTRLLARLARGAVAGLVLGLISVRYVSSLFFEVQATDPAMLATPVITIVSAAAIAAIPAVIRALRTDPAAMLRAD